MWSGPRTVSTALMRSFGNRPDTVVVDEPLYGYYLARTGAEHPGRDEVIASMPADCRVVLTELAAAPLPAGKSVYYQKHMTHHLLPEVDRGPLGALSHAFLIRDPRRLLASYARVRSRPTLADLGLRQQAEIFRAFGGPVIDSADILREPASGAGGALRCARRAIRPGHAVLAGRPAADGWRLGPVLVRQRVAVDRVRPVPGAGRRRTAAEPGAAGRPLPAVLRGARRPPPAVLMRLDHNGRNHAPEFRRA